MVEPISAIALAVAAGAAAASQDVAAKAIKDAYNGLITLIKDVYRNQQHVQESVDSLQKEPEDKHRRAALERELKEADVKIDERLLKAAQAVIKAVESHSAETARAIGMDIREFKAAALHIEHLQASKAGTTFPAGKVDIAGIATFNDIGGKPSRKQDRLKTERRETEKKAGRLFLTLGFIAFVALGCYSIYRSLSRHPRPPIRSPSTSPAHAAVYPVGNPIPPLPTAPCATPSTEYSPNPVFKDIAVESDPPGAAITLDEGPPLKAPHTFNVSFGSHRLTANLNGYLSTQQAFQFNEATPRKLVLKLRPNQSDEIAALSVQIEPPGASILLDGTPPQQPPNTFTHVPFGIHQLTATLDNYEPIRQDIQVRSGMSPEIRLSLKVAQSREIAALSVQSEPPGAAILLDGIPPGAPPNTFTHVPFGIHQLTATLDDFEPIRQDIQVRSGMSPEIHLMLLAEKETGRDLNVFLRAATLGDSYAMMKVGRLYLKKGTPKDDEKGFIWLNRAYNAPQPNLEAGAYVADCYLSGRGTKQDVQQAEDIIMLLANKNVVPALTLAGSILQQKADSNRTEAGESDNPEIQKKLQAQANALDRQARQWWERAGKDDWNASAHLGKYYEEGRGGVEKSEEEAEKLYKNGITYGNALSMFFYGLMLEKRPGRHSEAETLIKQAAAKGFPAARKWCKENHVDFTEVTPDGGRQ